jgi:predicted nucleotidyltransferase
MNKLIEENLDGLVSLCQRFQVRRMELFGSVAGGYFDPATSDLDFLVTFKELEPGEYAEAYFGLLEALQDLFQRPVDLVVASAVKNPYFLREIEKTRTLLYAA